MNKIFMGKPIHWLMILITTTIIFSCGLNKMHVSNFNLFISIIFVSIAILIVLILKTSKQKN
jgi:phosphatidylserine synthase